MGGGVAVGDGGLLDEVTKDCLAGNLNEQTYRQRITSVRRFERTLSDNGYLVPSKDVCIDLIRHNRADYIAPTVYTENSELDIILKKVIDKIAMEQDLLHIKYKELETVSS